MVTLPLPLTLGVFKELEEKKNRLGDQEPTNNLHPFPLSQTENKITCWPSSIFNGLRSCKTK